MGKNIKVSELRSDIGICKSVPKEIPKGAIFDIEVDDNHFKPISKLSKTGVKDINEAIKYANDIFNEKSNENVYEGPEGTYVGTVMITMRQKVYGLTIGSWWVSLTSFSKT